MINCKNAMRQMPHFIDGTLAERLDSRVAGHLATCRACDAAYGSLLVAEASLLNLGAAIRAGTFDATAPELPERGAARRRPLLAWLQTPAPLWVPVGALAAAAFVVVALTTAPDGLSVEWGPPKSAATQIGAPPLGSLAMLEFLIVADPQDAGRLTASVAAIEAFLDAHPNDVAMHAKLAELYTYQLAHRDTPENVRDATRDRLTRIRERLSVLLATHGALGVRQ
jgi:hypothetical protein